MGGKTRTRAGGTASKTLIMINVILLLPGWNLGQRREG